MTDTSAKRTDTRRRWLSSALLTVLLALGLIVTTLAISTQISVERNFTIGTVKLNLNNKQAVIMPNEYLFEPGMTVVKDFFLENEGAECWYKLYFRNVAGDLANVLDVTVKNGDTILCSGKMSDLTRENMQFIGSLPAKGEPGSRLDLTISFYFPKDAGNTAQNGTLQFDLCADATQSAHNREDGKPPVFENK